jgi:rhodanese-related sulfurtransferase
MLTRMYYIFLWCFVVQHIIIHFEIAQVKYGSGSMVQRLPLGMAAGMALMVKPALLHCASATEIASAATSSPGQVVQAADLASGLQGGVEPQTVVSPEWLKSMLGNDKLKVVDASWYMPNEKRDTFQEYKDKHIPGAVFFDVDAISDLTSHLPHMLPSEAAFEAAVSALGIQNDSLVVVYDTKGIFSVARVWWMFRVFGHEKVWVLNGGLPKWQDAGFPVVSHESQLESSVEAVAAVKKVYSGQQIPEVKFKATLQPHLVWSADQVLYLSTENVASTPLLELHLLPTRVKVPMAVIMLENRALWID